ncbi:MAG: anti-sigma factor family protein [Planctomycetota bacterium]
MTDGIDFDALLDGELPEQEAAELRARIEADADLRREFERRRKLVEAVRGLPVEPAPPELAERLDAALAGGTSGGGNVLRGWWAPMAVAAALLVAVFVWPGGSSEQPLPTEARQTEKAGKTGKTGKAEKEPDELGSAGLKTFGAESETAADADDSAGALKEGLATRRSGRKGGKKDKRQPEVPQAEQKKAIPSPERLIAETVAGEPLYGERLPAYLRELGKLERAKLARHIESFGVLARPAPAAPAPAAKERKAAAVPAPPVVKLAFASDTEAKQVAALLRRAYPAEARRAKARAEAEAGAAGSGYSATISGAKGGLVAVEIEATKPQLDRIRTWLDRMSPRWRVQHANKMVRVGATGLPAAAVKPQRWRLELTFPPKPKPKRD